MTSTLFLTVVLTILLLLPDVTLTTDLLDEYVRHIDAVNKPLAPRDRFPRGHSEPNQRQKRQNRKSSVTAENQDWIESDYGTNTEIRQKTSRAKRDAASNEPSNEASQWTHREVLDGVGNVVLRWQPRHQEILFRVEARTLGYVGIGFSPNGGMEGADMVLAWVDDRSLRPYLLVSTEKCDFIGWSPNAWSNYVGRCITCA